jgi:isocitrate dehydrogenase
MRRSPKGTILNILGGTVFREPIVIKNVPRMVSDCTKTIIISRHAFGGWYQATDFKVSGKSHLAISFEPENSSDPIEHVVCDFPESGVTRKPITECMREYLRVSRFNLSGLLP